MAGPNAEQRAVRELWSGRFTTVCRARLGERWLNLHLDFTVHWRSPKPRCGDIRVSVRTERPIPGMKLIEITHTYVTDSIRKSEIARLRGVVDRRLSRGRVDRKKKK